MKVRSVTSQKGEICAEILADLPEWFGRPDVNARYVELIESLSMIAAVDGDHVIGFAALAPRTIFACELALLGVKRAFHRQGVGQRLCTAVADLATSQAYRYLTVKTVADSVPSIPYASTRKFYEAVGFVALEVLPTLWDEDTPCLYMIRDLR